MRLHRVAGYSTFVGNQQPLRKSFQAADSEKPLLPICRCSGSHTQKGLAEAAVQSSHVTYNVVIQWRINALKTNSVDPMPADLIEARRESALAQENLEHAEAVLAHLNLEYEVSQQNLQSAEKSKADAVNAVLVEQAKALVADLGALNEKRQHLRLVLQGLSLGTGAEAGRIAGNLIHEGMLDTVSDLPMDRSQPNNIIFTQQRRSMATASSYIWFSNQ
jgi:hypothetical protein